jgi:putative Ca2+/H+ antiporter (TMEM165/GDT1 family)
MIAVIILSSKYSRSTVFVGAFAALVALSAVGVMVGQVLFQYVPRQMVEIGAGVLFVVFGLLTLLLPDKKEEVNVDHKARWGDWWPPSPWWRSWSWGIRRSCP